MFSRITMQIVAFRPLYDSCLFRLKIRHSYLISIRRRSKKKKSFYEKTSCDLALEHFDTFYRPMFGDLWPSIRISLLTTKKMCAVLNSYTNTEHVNSGMRDLGAYNILNDAAAEQARAMERLNSDLGDDAGVTDKVAVGTKELEERSNINITKPDVNRGPRLIRSEEDSDEEAVNLSEQYHKDIETPETDSVSQELNEELIKQLSADTSRTNLDIFLPPVHVYSERDALKIEEASKSVFTPADTKVTFVKKMNWSFPEDLEVMVCSKGNISRFPDPKGTLLTHYMMDAASVLPVIALDLQQDDSVLDLCAAPGGKTLTMLQTGLPERVTCNDTQMSRLTRLKTMLRYYLPGEVLTKVNINNQDGRDLDQGQYNKVLVDVPCNTDRHVLSDPDNNLFNKHRLPERLAMQNLQTKLLVAGIKCCAPGGSVVYSTCTLSFAQNDGVIQQAIDDIWKSTNIDLVIEDLSPMVDSFKNTFNFYDGCRFGQLVIPSLSSNFGPMYFCKLNRLN